MDLTNLNTLETFLTCLTVLSIMFIYFIAPLLVGKTKTQHIISLITSIIILAIEVAIFMNVSLTFWVVFNIIAQTLNNRVENITKAIK